MVGLLQYTSYMQDATISWKCDVGHFRKSKGIFICLGNQLYHKNKNQPLDELIYGNLLDYKHNNLI